MFIFSALAKRGSFHGTKVRINIIMCNTLAGKKSPLHPHKNQENLCTLASGLSHPVSGVSVCGFNELFEWLTSTPKA